MANFVVVLAGGAGTRFWPSGRRARPKQLLPITGGKSMLAETMDRCADLAPADHRYVVTNEVQVEATRRECPDLPPEHVVAEPSMRNTAAAIGLAAVLIHRRDPEAVMVVLPADHHISPKEKFEACFRAAIARATEAPSLLTIGIKPTGPATGYGYIEAGDPVATANGHPVLSVASFVEKPDAKTAQRFVESGRYFWNAGTFVWRVEALLDAFRAFLPGHAAVLDGIREKLDAGGTFTAEDYARFESIPIDKGIMEKASNVEVIPSTFLWDDVGSWLSVDRLHDHDARGNVVRGDHLGVETRNCIVVSRDHLVATLGVEDLIIVHTPDATLVCPKDRAEDVRAIVKLLEEQGRSDLL